MKGFKLYSFFVFDANAENDEKEINREIISSCSGRSGKGWDQKTSRWRLSCRILQECATGDFWLVGNLWVNVSNESSARAPFPASFFFVRGRARRLVQGQTSRRHVLGTNHRHVAFFHSEHYIGSVLVRRSSRTFAAFFRTASSSIPHHAGNVSNLASDGGRQEHDQVFCKRNVEEDLQLALQPAAGPSLGVT